jgi:predicted ATPase
MSDGVGAGPVLTGSTMAAPMEAYRRRLLGHEERESGLKAWQLWLGYLRLALVVGFLAAAWFTVFLKEGPRWGVVVPMVLCVGVGVWLGRVSRRLGAARRAAEMYRLGMARIEDRWVGLEERAVPGKMSAEVRGKLDASLYANDLDIVGRGGMFELLCRARTRMGEETLLTWLLEPAGVGEIVERQAAVEELRGRVEFRERMGVAGETAAVGVEAEALREWAAAEDVLTQGWMPWVAGVLAVAAAVLGVGVILLVAGGTIGPVGPGAASEAVGALLVVLLVEAGVRRPFAKKMAAVLDGTDEALRNMQLLAALLEVMERESFQSARLGEIAGKLRSHAVAGSAAGSVAIGRLARLGEWRDSMDNMILKAVNLPLMYSVQVAWAVQRWRRRHGAAVGLWLEAVGEMEALLSLATYAYEHPGDVFPEFVEGDARVEAEEIGHPLIAAAKCVRNSLRIGGETRVLLISGSNMSGKSTLMRTVGVNTVLAMCGAPVRAERLRLTPMRMGASLLVNDSLQEGHSRFYAEIEKLGKICALADSCAEGERSCADGERSCADGGRSCADGGSKSGGVMFLLDELLQGTNSKDRMVGAQGVVRALVEAGAIGIVTTHDLALAEMVGLKPGALRNMHFQDEIVDGQMRFDFTLREGAAMRSNGVELMRLIGLKV